MPTGFIYVVNTVRRDYTQPSFCNVPTEWDGRLYFGACKKPMRPKMEKGDYIFGVSPARTPARRFVFVATIQESITYAEAYSRFRDLHGPAGPIHVRPFRGTGTFPQSDYQHIPESMHPQEWKDDLATDDRFFVCHETDGWVGRWLGPHGPEIDKGILEFLKKCSVHGHSGRLGRNSGTLKAPIAHGQLYTGLHLETDKPEELLKLCAARMCSDGLAAELDSVAIPQPHPSALSKCHGKRSRC